MARSPVKTTSLTTASPEGVTAGQFSTYTCSRSSIRTSYCWSGWPPGRGAGKRTMPSACITQSGSNCTPIGSLTRLAWKSAWVANP